MIRYDKIQKGRKLRQGDRVQGHYIVPGVGESDFSGTISEIESDQGQPRGQPSAFKRAYVRLDKPMILNPEYPNHSSSRRETVILQLKPNGEFERDNYVWLTG